MGTDKIFQHFDFFCLVKRKHRLLVSLFRKLFEHFITDLSGRTSCQDDPGLFFQFLDGKHTFSLIRQGVIQELLNRSLFL